MKVYLFETKFLSCITTACISWAGHGSFTETYNSVLYLEVCRFTVCEIFLYYPAVTHYTCVLKMPGYYTVGRGYDIYLLGPNY